MEWLVAIISIVAGVVTVTWFVRDIRRENSKILKAMLDVQKGQSEILEKIEGGQRKGFETLAQILTKIEEGQRKGFESLAQILAKVGV